MQKLLARLEGIWVEPASAAGLAGLAHEIAAGKFQPQGESIVAICTGHGLKDSDIITKGMEQHRTIPPTLKDLERVIVGE
jgi:threonine synthase